MTGQVAYYNWLDKLCALLDFRKTGPGPADYAWKCGDPETRDRLALSKQAASDLGVPWDSMIAIARMAGACCCDCEILFNCDDRDEVLT